MKSFIGFLLLTTFGLALSQTECVQYIHAQEHFSGTITYRQNSTSANCVWVFVGTSSSSSLRLSFSGSIQDQQGLLTIRNQRGLVDASIAGTFTNAHVTTTPNSRVEFVSNPLYTSQFTISYSFEVTSTSSCGGSFNDSTSVSGVVYGPNQGGYYPPNSNCTWIFTSSLGASGVNIFFPDIFIEAGYDFMYLYRNFTLYTTYTGLISGNTVIPSSVASVQFVSDNIVEFDAWNFTYTFKYPPSSSPSVTPSITPSISSTPSVSSSSSPSRSPSSSPSSSPSASRSASPSPSSSVTPSPSPSVTPSTSASPSLTPTPSVSPPTICGSTATSLFGTFYGPSDSSGQYPPNYLCTWNFPADFSGYSLIKFTFYNVTLTPSGDTITIYQSSNPVSGISGTGIDFIQIELAVSSQVVFRSDFQSQNPTFYFTWEYIFTASPSATPTSSVTPSVTASPSSSVTPTVTPTTTPTSTVTPTVSPTSSPTSSVTPSTSSSVTPSITPSVSSSVTPTVTPTSTPSPSSIPSSSATPLPSSSSTPFPSSSSTPLVSASSTPFVSNSPITPATPSRTPTKSPSSSPSPSKAASPSRSPSAAPSSSKSPSPSKSPSKSPTPSRTPSKSSSPSKSPSRTPSPPPHEVPTDEVIELVCIAFAIGIVIGIIIGINFCCKKRSERKRQQNEIPMQVVYSPVPLYPQPSWPVVPMQPIQQDQM